jgi:hypothetical protein
MPASTPWWSTPSIAAPRPGRRPTLGLAATIVALIPLTSRATMADPLPPHPSIASHAALRGAPRPAADRYAIYPAHYGIAHGICERSLMHDVPPTAALPAGSAVGRGMDRLDRYCVGRILEYAPDRRMVRWYGGTGGYAYAVTPLTTYRRDGLYCRDFLASASLDDHRTQAENSACRAADGTWHSVRPRSPS